MTEFRMPPTSARQRRFEGTAHGFMWGLVALLLAIALVSRSANHFSNYATNITLMVIGVVLLGSIIGAHYIAFAMGLKRIEKDLVFILTDNELVRRRPGWPDVRIAFSEIKALRSGRKHLFVKSSDDLRTIVVPKALEGFEALESELANHAPLLKIHHIPLIPVARMLALTVCCVLFMWARNSILTIAAGMGAVLLLAWDSSLVAKQLRLHSHLRKLLIGRLAFTWATAVLLGYFRACHV